MGRHEKAELLASGHIAESADTTWRPVNSEHTELFANSIDCNDRARDAHSAILKLASAFFAQAELDRRLKS